MFLKKKTQQNKHSFRKKGFVLVPVVLATFILGMLGIGLSSMYSGTFGVMNAGKAASQAKQFATVEGDILKVAGYDGTTDVTHDWQSLQNVVGADGANWESKVEDTGRTETSPSGDQVKVMKVSVRKNNELVSRYSEEVPLVNGADTMSRAEIMALINALQGQVDNLTSQLETLNGKVDNIQSQIDSINNQLTVLNTTINALQTKVENYRSELLNSIATEKAARESADAAEADARKAAINKEVNDRNAAIKASTDSLNSRMDSLASQISDLRTKVNANTASITQNSSNISANTKAINDIKQSMATLKATVDTNSGNIATIKSRLDGNEFIKNDSNDKSKKLSLAYNESDKKLYAYYGGTEIALGTQGDANLKIVTSKKEYPSCAKIEVVYDPHCDTGFMANPMYGGDTYYYYTISGIAVEYSLATTEETYNLIVDGWGSIDTRTENAPKKQVILITNYSPNRKKYNAGPRAHGGPISEFDKKEIYNWLLSNMDNIKEDFSKSGYSLDDFKLTFDY